MSDKPVPTVGQQLGAYFVERFKRAAAREAGVALAETFADGASQVLDVSGRDAVIFEATSGDVVVIVKRGREASALRKWFDGRYR